MTWPLVLPNDDGIRPGGSVDACFYCGQRVGSPHGIECVIVKKRVRVRYTFELEIDVPFSWTGENIEFHRGQSSWCADNALDDLETHVERLNENDHCLCGEFKCEYLGVADDTPRRDVQDEEQQAANAQMRTALEVAAVRWPESES